jgi:hypothetical protein
MASIIYKILILAILLFFTLGKLVIVSPPTLKKFFLDKYGAGNIIGIPYSIANYGDIPYGKSIVG